MRTRIVGLAAALLMAGCGGEACTFNSECAAGSYCASGSCRVDCSPTVPCASGQACTSFGQCVATDASTPDAGTPDAGTDAGTPDAGTDAGTDAEPLDAGRDAGFECAIDDDCDDGNACNGEERCGTGRECEPGTTPIMPSACLSVGGVSGVCRAGACALRCTTSAFGAPVRIEELTTDSSQLDARLSADERTIYFAGDAGGHLDVYSATRSDPLGTFGTPVAVAGVNTASTERFPSPTADGLSLYAGLAGYEIVVATRASTSATFGAFSAPVSFWAAGDGRPYVLPAENALLFDTAARGGAGGLDLFRVSRASGSFGTPVPVLGPDVNTPSNELCPVSTPDELTVFFTSDRGGRANDVFMATRTSTADPFGAAVPIDSVNTPGLDYPTWASADGCELYVTRSRTAPDGIRDLWVATRTP